MNKKNSKRIKKSLMGKLENVDSSIVSLSNNDSLSKNVSLLNSLDVSYCHNLNVIKQMLVNTDLLVIDDIKKYWIMIMFDSSVSMKDRLTASKLLAQAEGMFEKGKTVASTGGAVYKWRTTEVEAEIVHAEETAKVKTDKGDTSAESGQ